MRTVHRKMKKYDAAGGYMTLEATLIFPIIFALVIMLVYLNFLLYDRCRMTQDCYTAAYHQSILRNRKSGTGEIETDNYWMLSQKSAEVSGGANAVGTAQGDMFPAFSLRGTVNKCWTLKVSRKARKTDPPASFRRYRRILDVAGKAKKAGGL